MSRILRPEDISEDDLRVPAPGLYRVLLVRRKRDENAVVLDHLETTACNEFKFSSVTNTTEALAKLKESPYDLVVLASDLPEGQEFDAVDALKKAFPDLAIVILSNTKNRDLALAAIKRGVHDFLTTNPSYPIELVKLRLLYSIERSRTERSARSIARTEKFVLRSVVENAPLMFARLDQAFLVRDCNKNFADMLQQPRKHVRRREIVELLPDFTIDELERLASGDQIMRKRVSLPDAEETGGTREAYWNCFGWPFYKTNSAERESIIVTIDVTREVQLDQFREEFLAAVAHDIKNPVTGQEKVLTALLNVNKDLPPDVVSAITTVRNGSRQLLNLLSTLVEIYRLDSGEVTTCCAGASVNEAIEQQLEEVKCIADATDKVVVLELASDIPSAAIDAISAYRLVSNLVHNALQHAPAKTEVRVKTYFDDENVVIEVNNKGVPIKAADMAKLFQRFSRSAHRTMRTNSSGLGLYLCKRTVELCGGTIFCLSDEDTGTTFVTKLPRI